MSDIKDICMILPDNAKPFASFNNERDSAMQELKDHAVFCPIDNQKGPYKVTLSIQDNRLVFEMQDKDQHDLPSLILSLKPYKRLIKDYVLMIESYQNARSEGLYGKLEAIDMGRRGLHDEAGQLLIDRLAGKITMDLETARRLYTLIFVLHMAHTSLHRLGK